jgi:hypothetical protein
MRFHIIYPAPGFQVFRLLIPLVPFQRVWSVLAGITAGTGISWQTGECIPVAALYAEPWEHFSWNLKRSLVHLASGTGIFVDNLIVASVVPKAPQDIIFRKTFGESKTPLLGEFCQAGGF